MAKEPNSSGAKKRKRKKKKWPVILGCVLIIIIAFAFMLYPLVSNFLAERDKSLVISEYNAIADTLEDEATAEMFRLAREYNAMIVPQVTEEETFTDEALAAAAESYDDLLNINSMGMMGYVDVPKIDVYLPIYHGTEADTLENGVGHIIGTSLPVGGESTHSALSAHSGMATQKMFSDLDDLEQGDIFYIHVVDETFAYQVTEINVVLPEELSLLAIRKGEDLVTLITCTPFGVNTHRLLVTGSRIPYEEAEVIEAIKEGEEAQVHVNKWAREYIEGLLIGLGLAVLVIIIVVIYKRRKKQKKAQAKMDARLAAAAAANNDDECDSNQEWQRSQGCHDIIAEDFHLGAEHHEKDQFEEK